jgi:hypothetical protein
MKRSVKRFMEHGAYFAMNARVGISRDKPLIQKGNS